MSVKDNFPSVKPSLLLDFANTKVLDPRISYARASTGTYYDDNTVAIAEQNLFLYSQEFNNAVWTKASCLVTADSTTAPDGTSTADTVAANSTISECYLRYTTQQTVSSVFTVSVFAKAGTVNFVRLRNLAISGSPNAWFNLSTGAVGTVGSGLTAALSSIGNGWYRCSITGTTLSSITNNLVDIAPTTADGNTSVINGDSIYLWGAQLEQR